MLRIGASCVFGFILLFVQGYVVMLLNGYSSIQFQYAPGILAVWLVNCMLAFSIMSQLKPWFERRIQAEQVESEQ